MRKGMKIRNITIVAVLMLLLVAASCSMELFDQSKITSITITADVTEIDIDDAARKSVTLTAVGRNSAGSIMDLNMVWEYDHTVFTAIGTPTSTLRLELNESSPTADITGRTVIKGYDSSNAEVFDEAVINVTGDLQSLWFEDENGTKITTVQLSQKDTVSYSIGTYPRAADNFTLIGRTEDKDIADITVDSATKKVTIRTGTPGTARVYVDTERGGFETALQITISDMVLPETSASRIVIENGSFMQLSPGGDEVQLKAVVYDQYSQAIEDAQITWTSSASQNVSVRQSGQNAYIKPNRNGSARITAQSVSNPALKATLDVSVGTAVADIIISPYQPAGAKALTLPEEEAQLTSSIPIGKKTYYIAEYLPADTDQIGVRWESDNPDILRIIGDNADEIVTVEAIAEGTANLVATSTQNQVIASYVTIAVYDPATEPDLSIRSIRLSPSATELKVGESVRITSAAIMQGGTEGTADLVWSTSGSAVEIVGDTSSTESVEVEAKSAGLAIVTAKALSSPDIQATCAILVYTEDEPLETSLQRIIASPSSLVMTVGSRADVDISYLPGRAEKGIETPTSSSDAVSITSHTEDRISISAVKAGTANITITSSSDPDKTANISVRVVTEAEVIESAKVASVEFDETLIEIMPPYATTEVPINVTSRDSSGNILTDSYTWELRQDADAISFRSGSTVGYVSALKPGTATIKATSRKDPSISATCTVQVYGALEAISISPSTMELYTGGKAVLRASFSPEDAVGTDVVWEEYASDGRSKVNISQSLSNRAVATVTGTAAGTTEVRAISRDDGSIYGTCTITVTADVIPDGTMPASVSLVPSALTIDPPFDTQIITATVLANNGSIYPVGVDWSLENGSTAESDEPIAVLSPTGEFGVRITPKMAGEATLTATSKVDESVRASIPIIIGGRIGRIEFLNLIQQLVSVMVGNVTQVQVQLSTSSGGETVETDIEWYQEGFEPVYDKDGKLEGYDTNGDGEVDDNGSGMAIRLTPTQSGSTYGCSIEAVKEGTYALVCRSKIRPEIYARIAVNVTPVPQIKGSITINPGSLSMAPGDDRVLITASIETEEAYTFPSDTDIEMSVDNSRLLEFSSPLWLQDGKTFTQYAAPGTQPGDGYLTVSLPDYPGISAARIRVSIGGALTGFTPHNPEGDDDVLIIKKGDVVSIGVDYQPSNTMEKGVQWTSENPNIVSVEPSEEGTRAIVSGVGVGTTKIIAESINHPGIDGIRYAYTVTVKPVVESVSFTYTDSSGNTSKGLTFNVSDNVGTMQLECEIFPEILQDTVKLLVAPHNDGPAGDEGVPSLKEINGTVNDYTFTPMQGLLGSYQYDIMQTSDDGLTNEVIDVLTINVRTQQTSLLLADAEGQNIYTGNVKYSFSKDNPSTEFDVQILNEQLQPLQNVEWKSSNVGVARIIETSSDMATVQLRYPNNKEQCAGHAVITGTVGNDGATITYTIDVYVGIEIPDTLWEALSQRSPFRENEIFMNDKIFYPEMADSVTSLDLSDFRSSSGLPLELNDGTYFWLNSNLFKNLRTLDVSNTRLSSTTLSLNGASKLQTLIAEQPSSGGGSTFRLSRLSNVPSTLYSADLDNNNIDSLSSLSSTNLNTLSMRNNSISSFTDSSLPGSIRSVDVSDTPSLKTVSVSKPNLSTLKANNCTQLNSIDVESRYISTISAYNSAINEVDIDAACTNLYSVDLHDNDPSSSTFRFRYGTTETTFKRESCGSFIDPSGYIYAVHIGTCSCSTRIGEDTTVEITDLPFNVDFSGFPLWVRVHLPDGKGGTCTAKLKLTSSFFNSYETVVATNEVSAARTLGAPGVVDHQDWMGNTGGYVSLYNTSRSNHAWLLQAPDPSWSSEDKYISMSWTGREAMSELFNRSYATSGSWYEFEGAHKNGWMWDNVDVLIAPFGG